MNHCQYCTHTESCTILKRCQKDPEPVAALHRPVTYGDEAMKGGLSYPFEMRPVDMIPLRTDPVPSNPAMMGWVCPKCLQSNAPTQPTCFTCAMRQGAVG